jgi:TfoX/Sxy family transcriptional regulator of competence genes
MAHKPAELQKQAETACPAGIDLRFRPMFGGIGGYAGGRMFLSLSDIGLALKLDDAGRMALLKLKGAKPLRYEPSMPPSKSYVVVPDAMLGDIRALRAWISRSIVFVGTLAPKAPRKAKK